MIKLKEFKEIATNVGRVLNKYWYFRNHRDMYASQKNMTENQVDKILTDLTIHFTWTIKDEDDAQFKEESSKIFHNILLVDSFYNNHSLFTHMVNKLQITTLDLQFRTKIFVNNLNETTPKVDLEEVKKNLNFVNNREINFLVLEKALSNGNENLYQLIKPYFDWKKDEFRIVNSMFSVICNYGEKIKDNPLSQEIRKYINEKNLTPLLNDMLNFTKKNEKNVNKFFSINILKNIAENEEQYNKFHLNTIKNSNKQMEQFFDNLDTSKDYSKIILQYIDKSYDNVTVVDKFKFLNSKNLLNDQVWDLLINKQYKNFLGAIVENYESLQPILGNDKILKAMTLYKNEIVNSYMDDEKITNFLKKYPEKLTKDELFSIISKHFDFNYVTNKIEQEALSLIHEKYPNVLTLPDPLEDILKEEKRQQDKREKEQRFVDVLYEKYFDIMNNKDNVKDFLKQSQSDLFVSTYLKTYFEKNPQENNVETKKDFLPHFNVFNSSHMALTLEWIIDNDLLKHIIPNFGDMPVNLFTNQRNNYWVPLLIEKYNVKPDSIIKNTVASLLSNDELFKFILNTYTLEPKTEQLLCKSVFAINATDLATEMFKNNIVPNDYYEEIFKISPTEAGNILLKSKLKKKLETKFLDNDIKKQKEKIKKI